MINRKNGPTVQEAAITPVAAKGEAAAPSASPIPSEPPIPEVDPKKTHVVLEHKHDRPLTACHWSSDGRFVFFGAQDNDVHRLNIEDKSVTRFQAHDSWIRAIATSPDSRICYSGGYDGRLVWWPADAEKPEPIRSIDAHAGWIRALAVHPSGDRLATCGNDQSIRIWNTADGSLMHTLTGHQSHVYNVAFTPDGANMISCDLKANIKLWDANTGSLKQDLPIAEALYKYDKTFRADIGGARSIAMDSTGHTVAMGGITNVSNAFAGIGEVAVVLLNLTENKIATQFEAKAKHRGCTWGLSWHPNDFWVGVSGGGGGGWIMFWKTSQQQEFFQLKLKSDGRGMCLSPDKRSLAVAHADMHLRTYLMGAPT